MNVFKLFTTLIFVCLFTACSEDENDNETIDIPDTLVGTWNLIAIDADTDISGTLADFEYDGAFESVGENLNYTVVFTETTYTVQGSYDIVTTGTLNGLPIDPSRDSTTDVLETGTYTYNDDGLTIDGQFYDLGNEDLPEDLQIGQEFDITFNSNGNMVMSELFTSSMTELIPLDIEVDAQLVWEPVN
ncbi:MAG: hypothetical protein AAGF77_04030 [Bacteroidota bacterium]